MNIVLATIIVLGFFGAVIAGSILFDKWDYRRGCPLGTGIGKHHKDRLVEIDILGKTRKRMRRHSSDSFLLIFECVLCKDQVVDCYSRLEAVEYLLLKGVSKERVIEVYDKLVPLDDKLITYTIEEFTKKVNDILAEKENSDDV